MRDVLEALDHLHSHRVCLGFTILVRRLSYGPGPLEHEFGRAASLASSGTPLNGE